MSYLLNTAMMTINMKDMSNLFCCVIDRNIGLSLFSCVEPMADISLMTCSKNGFHGKHLGFFDSSRSM